MSPVVLRAAGDTRTVLVASLAEDAFLAVSWWRYRAGSWRTSTV